MKTLIKNGRVIDPATNTDKVMNLVIEDDKILYLCRTAMNGAENFHNTNYIIFDTIQL